MHIYHEYKKVDYISLNGIKELIVGFVFTDQNCSIEVLKDQFNYE